MTSLLVRHSLRSISTSSASAARISCARANGRIRTRALHSSSVVLKKKQAAAATFEDDLFGEAEEVDDLFSETPQPKKAAARTAETESAVPALYKKLSVEEKTKRFDDLYAKMEAYLDKGLVGKARRRTPPIRHSVWTHMLQLATQKDQLERMAGMFGRWKDVTGSGLDEQFAELFVDRCTQLHCQHLALRVFGDHAKYSLPLSLSAARALLHSLHMLPPHGLNTGSRDSDLSFDASQGDNATPTTLSDVMAAAALYRVYNLKPIVSDLPSCAMVIAACLRHVYPARPPPTKGDAQAETASPATEGAEAVDATAATSEGTSTSPQKLPKNSKHALSVVDALLPQLKDLLNRSPPAKWAPLKDPKERNRVMVSKVLAKKANGTVKVLERTKVRQRERDWVRWCLRKVDLLMRKRNQGGASSGVKGESTATEISEDGRLVWLKEWRVKAGHVRTAEAV
ncbi:hypothetical protein VKT23_014736 [Stygiomarasmius scandens]|uniref:Uncharacterized protein n=1 Tax=Marasmiellus scandens TaxID=2682957 RepID=A0ABR1J4B8_9AGAR